MEKFVASKTYVTIFNNLRKIKINKQMKLLILIFTLFSYQLNGQTFKQQFHELFNKKDVDGQKQLLEKWEKEDGDDPELFVAYYNYYAHKSKDSIITLGNEPTGKDGYVLKSDNPDKNDSEFYLSDGTYYEPKLLNKGFDWINKGIEKYPNRLDMRFGKIYMLGEIEDYENFTKEIIKAIEYSQINKNKWTWTDNKPLENPEDFLLSGIQDYQTQLYYTGNDDLLENMKQIAETILKYYPEHIESITNISTVYMLQKQYDKGLEYLFKAEKINPKDSIVLNNIGEGYKLKGDKENAIKYYKLVVEYGNKEIKEYAQKNIDELTNK